MDHGAVVIGILELCNLCVICTGSGPKASDVKETAVHSVSEVDSLVVIWNLS